MAAPCLWPGPAAPQTPNRRQSEAVVQPNPGPHRSNTDPPTAAPLLMESTNSPGVTLRAALGLGAPWTGAVSGSGRGPMTPNPAPDDAPLQPCSALSASTRPPGP